MMTKFHRRDPVLILFIGSALFSYDPPLPKYFLCHLLSIAQVLRKLCVYMRNVTINPI